MSGRNALLIARQAGTANAFDGVAQELESRGWTVQRIAQDHAAKLWDDADVLHLTTDEACALIRTTPPDVVVTGTSFDAAGDGEIWATAAAAAIPTVAYFDGWTHYAARFTVSAPFDRMPRHIAAIDAMAVNALRDAGCPAKVEAVGNLVFDGLAAFPQGSEGQKLLIVTEPVDPARGFSELEVVAAVIDATEQSQPIVIKPHPREDPAKYAPFVAHPNVGLAAGGRDRIEVLAEARAVVGITSMLLVEAAFVGLPVLSVQPTGRAHEGLISPERGISICTEVDELRAALSVLLAAGRNPQPLSRSAPRFGDLIERAAAP